MKRLDNYRGVAVLAGLVVGLPLLIWTLALRRTVSDYRQVVSLEQRIELLRAEAPAADSLPEVPDEQPGGEGSLLKEVLALAAEQGATAERYIPRTTRSEGSLRVMTHEFVFGGAYIPLLRIVEGIERGLPGGKIVSLAFRGIPARRPGETPQLKLTLLLQEIVETN